MKYFEKYHLIEEEWNFIRIFPYYIHLLMKEADGEISVHESEPYWRFTHNFSCKPGGWVLVDICKDIIDLKERNYIIYELLINEMEKRGYEEGDIFYKKKEILIDHFLPVLNLLESFRKAQILEFSYHLAYEVADIHGLKNNTIDIEELLTINSIFKWFEFDVQYHDEENRLLYLKHVDNTGPFIEEE